MDGAVVGGLVSAAVTIVALIIHKARCIVRCSPDGEEPDWSCAAGFTDSPLEPNRQVETVELPDNALLYRKRGR